MPASFSTPRRLLIGLPLVLLVLALAWLFWPRSVVRVLEPTPQPSAASQAEAPRPVAALSETAAAPELPGSAAERRDLAGQAPTIAPAPVPEFSGSLRDARSGAPIVGAELRYSPRSVDAKPAVEGVLPGPADLAVGAAGPADGQPTGSFSVLSDGSGRFVLPWPGPGDFSGRHADYVTVRYPNFEPEDGFVVLMERAASLKVRVLDTEGEPIVGAGVEAWRCDGLNPLGEPTALGRSDDAGIVLLGGLRAGNFLVRATPPAGDLERPQITRHALQSGVAVASGGQAEVRLTLHSGSYLALELDAKAGPIPAGEAGQRRPSEACLVTLQPRWDGLPGAKLQAAEISGLVALDGEPLGFGPLSDGPLTIVCWTPWAQRFEFAAALPRQEPLRLTLPVGGPWQGVVRAEGQALEGALVAIVEATRAGELSFQAAQSQWLAEQQLQAAASQDSALALGSKASGTGGEAAGPAPLAAALPGPQRLLVTATDERGRFLFPRRPAGVELYCLVWPPDYEPGAGPGNLAPTGGRISKDGLIQQDGQGLPPEFELRRSAGLSGWVRCLDGGSPEGTRLELRVAQAAAAEPRLSTQAETNGAFRFEAVSNQALILEAHLEGYKPVTVDVPATAGRGALRPPAFSIELEPVFSLRGQVLDWEGRAIAGALVRARLDRLELGRTTADQSGAFELTGLPRGLLQIAASAAETSSTTGSEQMLRLPSSEPLVLRLRLELPGRPASVAGRAIRAGSAASGAEGSAIPGLFARGLGPYAVVHQSGSSYRIEGINLPVSGFELGAPGYETLRVPLQDLAPGGHRELPLIELQRSIAVRFTGLDEVVHALDHRRALDQGFVLLVPLDAKLGGPLGERKTVDLQFPGPKESEAGIWRLPAAIFDLQVPTLELRTILDLSLAPEELEVHLPDLLGAPAQSGD